MHFEAGAAMLIFSISLCSALALPWVVPKLWSYMLKRCARVPSAPLKEAELSASSTTADLLHKKKTTQCKLGHSVLLGSSSFDLFSVYSWHFQMRSLQYALYAEIGFLLFCLSFFTKFDSVLTQLTYFEGKKWFHLYCNLFLKFRARYNPT